MAALTAAFLLSFLALAAIGAGPACWLISGATRRGTALAISPILGLALVSVGGTVLTQMDWPVSRWGVPAFTLGVSLSFALLLVATYHRPASPASSAWRAARIPVGLFLLAALLLWAPLAIGGLQHQIFRGNGSDSLNYIATAGALSHERLSWLSTASQQELIDRHPLYVRASQLVATRWTTMMTLAFASQISGVPAYKTEFALSSVYLLLAFIPTFLLARESGISRLSAATTGLVVSAGFWAQFILDEHADSHQQAIAIMLLVAWASVRAQSAAMVDWGLQALIGLCLTALLFIYPEIVPMIALGLALFVGARLIVDRASVGKLWRWGASAGLAIVLALPIQTLIVRFLSDQIHSAATTVNTWHLAYFAWLYASPVSGLWGFGPLATPGVATSWLRLLVLPLSGALTLVLVAAVWEGVRRRAPAALTMSVTMAIAALLQWAWLWQRGQLWAGGKGLSFGFAFFILVVVGYGLSATPAGESLRTVRMRTAARFCASAFLLGQVALAFARPVMVMTTSEYPNYIRGHGEYRQHDWNYSPFLAALSATPGAVVWTSVSNPWVAAQLSLAMGWSTRLVDIGANLDREQMAAPAAQRDAEPEFMVIEGRTAASMPTTAVLASNTELSLVRVPQGPVVVAIHNPNGLEGSPEAPFFWTGGAATTIDVLSESAGCGRLQGQALVGPSLPGVDARHVAVTSQGESTPATTVVKDGPLDLPVRLIAGLNTVSLRIDDPVKVHLASDPRPLMMRIDGLRILRSACPTGGD